MAELIKKTFTKAIIDAGLRLPGESVGAFSQEVKKLTPADRAWFVERFKIEQGIEVTS